MTIQDFLYLHISLLLNYLSYIIIFIIKLYIYNSELKIIYFILEQIIVIFSFVIIYLFFKGKIGQGDIHFVFLSSLILDFPYIFFSLALSSLLSLVIITFCFNEIDFKRKIPFIPFIFLGTTITYFFN